jgi:UrcA family protein
LEDDMNKFLIATSATLSAFALSTAASAQQGWQVETVQVSYADLDLGTSAGREALEDRLTSAARQLCSTGTQAGITADFERRRCLREAHFSAQSGLRVALARANRGDNRAAVLAAR